MKIRSVCVMLALLGMPMFASAEMLTVSVTNNQPDGGFTFSPPWVAFHDGTFDAFNSGSAASAGIKAIAELADAGPLGAEFTGSGASGVTGMVTSPTAPPPIIPGEMGTLMIDVPSTMTNRYFSFASMLVPSNDLFLGNDDAMGYEVFDAAGNFNGPLTIMVYSQDLWDSGTEVNDIGFGAAFIVGNDPMQGTPENGVVTPLFEVSGIDTYLASIVGQETPIGTLTDGLGTGELVATFTITPEPASLALLGIGGLALIRRR